MADFYDFRYKKLDGDLLLTLACPNNCDFCVFSCTASKEPEKWMPEDTIRRVAAEYSKNDIGVRISGGEPFYDLKRLEKCIDVLLEYYNPIELLIISSGFFGSNTIESKKCLNSIHRKGFDRLVLSVDRFHAKNVPLKSLVNIIKISKEMNIQVMFRLSVDSKSYTFIDHISKIASKYVTPIELHTWKNVGKGEQLEEFDRKKILDVQNYLISSLKENLIFYGKKINALSLFTLTPKKLENFIEFFPTTFPNGNVYSCSFGAKISYMGNINRESLNSMIKKIKRTISGYYMINYNCSFLSKFLLRDSETCDFCRNYPLEKNKKEESIGRKFIKINLNMPSEKIKKELLKEKMEFLLSFDLNESDLNRNVGMKISDMIEFLQKNKIKFILSKPLPACLKINTKYPVPKNCYECNELFNINGEKFISCSVLKNKVLGTVDSLLDRKQIYGVFKSYHDQLSFPDKCLNCLFRIRNFCNGLCFKK